MKRHSADTVKQTHRGANAVDVFGNDDGETAEFFQKALDARLRHFIKAVIFNRFAKQSPDKITETVADQTAERSGEINFKKTVWTEITVMSQNSRQQQS